VLWYEFTKWLLGKTEKFPKRVRFTFSNRINNLGLDVLEDITEVQYIGDRGEKKGHLQRINLKLDRLRILLRMCHDMGILDHKGYEYAARQIDDAGRMTGGWQRERGKT